MKDFKNDSDTTLARFGRDKRARISSAERIERRPRLQRDAADSEHSSDSRPRASYNPNFTSDNRPVREDRAHRDDSRRSGNRSFGSDDRRRDDAADREFKLKQYGLPKELTKQEILNIAIMRYELSTNSFQKYMAVTIATNVSESTVAAVMENQNELQGIDVLEDSVRQYVDDDSMGPLLG